ncbi:MAG: hypothetical protein Q9175_000391 [Cornicularia normoerica]
MAASPAAGVILYPYPSIIRPNAPPPQQSPPHESTVFSVSHQPTAPVVAAAAPPFALDPILLALPGPVTTPVSVPVVAAPTMALAPIATPTPRLSATAQAPTPVQITGAPAPRAGQANVTPSSPAALEPSSAGIVAPADPYPMALTEPDKPD